MTATATDRARRGRAQELRPPRGPEGCLARRRDAARSFASSAPSGSGKTTFLRCINHLETIDSGRIEVNGHLIGYREEQDGELRRGQRARTSRKQRTEIGFVFQRFNLWPHMTALREHHRGARSACAGVRARRLPQATRAPARSRRPRRQARRVSRAALRVASSSASRSRARSR